MENEFDEELETKLQELTNCQNSNGVDSCLKCEKIIGCAIRNHYVDTVYKSMNSGSNGEFDFDG